MANLRLQLTITDETESSTKLDVIFDPRAHPVLQYKVKPQASDVIDESKFPPGCRLTIVLTFSDSSTATMQWTVDTFRGVNPGLPQFPQTVELDQLLIQFSQRCFLSDSGYTTWRFQLPKGPFPTPTYNVTTQSSFQDYNWQDREFAQSKKQILFRLADDMQNGASGGEDIDPSKSTHLFLKRRAKDGVAAQFAWWDDNQFVYLSSALDPVDDDLPIGNGLTLFADSGDNQMTLWQPCVYNITATNLALARSLTAGIIHISSNSVLRSWNENVAHRYYEGLALNHAFTMLPELTLVNAPQHNWETLIAIDESIPLITEPDDGQWNWRAIDSTVEYPQHSGALSNVLSTRILRVRMLANITESVSADLRGFRRQDGTPLHLDQLTLVSPPQGQEESVVWRLELTGSVDKDATNSAYIDPKTKQSVEQVVRAGGFALHFLPPGGNSQYKIEVTAVYGAAASIPGPVMPVVTCDMSQSLLCLYDCVPAAEDDLNGDQYAQLYVGTSGQSAANQGGGQAARWLTEIYNNMQRDPSIVFRRPGDSSKPADGSWSLQYAEQSSPTEKQYISMQLLFTPAAEDPSALPDDDSVLVFSRNPFSFADVHFHPLTSAGGQTGATKVADWNSVNNEWQILQLSSSPSYMVLPPQVVGEENVTSDFSAPSGIETDKTIMAVGMPTLVTYAGDQRTNAVKLPWDLHRLTTDTSLSVSRIDYEMLYGMVATTTVDHMRLTEAASVYGDLLGEFPPLDLPTNDPAHAALLDSRTRYLLARLHWSRIHREYRSRLGVFILQDSTSTDPESFTDTTQTIAQLRLNDGMTPDMSNGSGTPAIAQDYIQSSIVSSKWVDPSTAPPAPTPGAPDVLKGGALSGVDVEGIFNGIVSVRTTGKGNAAVLNPRFSAVGGFGTTRGTFNNGLSTLINAISMGRTVTYTVEQVGRIGCHWNRAKHVVVYERTVMPSRQFYNSQMRVAYRGLPLIRKVEEYVEFLQPDRVFSEESTAPQSAFASGFKCGEHKRIAVDSAWGSVVANQGWKVPLWNPAAGQPKAGTARSANGRRPAANRQAPAPSQPEVYPKPQLYLEITTPEQTLGSTDQAPSFLTADALLTHPEQVFFYTSFVETTPDTDTWKPVETVDFVSYPLVGPDLNAYGTGDLDAVPLPELPTPPGWEPVTFQIASPAVGINVTAGVVSTRTPLAAQLTRVTVTRGPRPKATTVRDLLGNGTTGLTNYTSAAQPLANISHAFASMRAQITAELAASNLGQTVEKLQQQAAKLTDAATQLTTSLSTAATGLQNTIEKPFGDAGTSLQSQVMNDRAIVQALLQQLYLDITWVTGSARKAPSTAAAALITHLRQTFQTTKSEIIQWKTRTEDEITGTVRIWTSEVETALASYAAQLGTPIGAVSPLRSVVIGLQEFQQMVQSIEAKIQATLDSLPLNADIATTVQRLGTSFDAAVSHLTASLTSLQQVPGARSIDPSVILIAFHTAILAGQFQTVVDQALQAAAGAVESSPERTAAIQALQNLKGEFQSIDQNISDILGFFDESILDLLRQVPNIVALYDPSLSLNKLQTQAELICDQPEVLIQTLQANCLAYLKKIADMTLSVLTQLGQKVAAWLIAQTSSIAGQLGPLVAPFKNLADAIGQLHLDRDFTALQTQLDGIAGQYRGVVQQAGQYVDQYVRQPVMAAYQQLAPEATNAMRVLRAFGAPPQVPNLDIQPPVVGFLYDGVAAKVPITPILARANQAGQILNALGVQLPTVALGEALIPADLKQFNLSDVMPNFAGLRLPGLFSGIKLPEIANRNVKVTHGWEPQSRRAWLQADVNIPFTDRMVVFNAGFASFVLANATFTAQSRIQNSGTTLQQNTQGSITGTWNIEIGDSNALISFASTTLAFDEHGKFQFQFKPQNLRLSDALKAITALVQTFSDPKSGFTYGATPTGVKCAFALPVPDTAALTSGFTGLKFSTSLALDFDSDFLITLAIGVSSKDRPFNFAIFILGGCGYLTAGVVYNISKGKFEPPMLEMAIGCSASLAIALGPISGGVYAQFAIELRNNGGGFSTGAFFQITGHVSICCVLSVDLVFRLEASYSNSVMVASGHFSISVSLFMFTFSVSRDVSMQMGKGGQSSTRLDVPPLRPTVLQNQVAALEGPDGPTQGLIDAFFPSANPDQPTFAARYLKLLL